MSGAVVGVGEDEDVGMDEGDVESEEVEAECALGWAGSTLSLAVDDVLELDLRDARAPPIPPPTPAATTTSATPTSIQNVLLRSPHILDCGGGTPYAVLSYAILCVSVPALGTGSGEASGW